MDTSQFIKKIRRKIRDFFLNSNASASILYYFYKGLGATLRINVDRSLIAEEDAYALAYKNALKNDPESSPEDTIGKAKLAVFCFWHDELFPVTYLKQDLRLFAIVSGSKDGSILEKLFRKLGLEISSGSSRRGGLKALLNAVRFMNDKQLHGTISVDGPMGPRHVPKDGAFYLAQKTGARIVPMRFIMHNSLKFPSWDKFQVPLPFSKIDVYFDKGFYITNEELNEEKLKEYRKKLADILKNLPNQ